MAENDDAAEQAEADAVLDAFACVLREMIEPSMLESEGPAAAAMMAIAIGGQVALEVLHEMLLGEPDEAIRVIADVHEKLARIARESLAAKLGDQPTKTN